MSAWGQTSDSENENPFIVIAQQNYSSITTLAQHKEGQSWLKTNWMTTCQMRQQGQLHCDVITVTSPHGSFSSCSGPFHGLPQQMESPSKSCSWQLSLLINRLKKLNMLLYSPRDQSDIKHRTHLIPTLGSVGACWWLIFCPSTNSL